MFCSKLKIQSLFTYKMLLSKLVIFQKLLLILGALLALGYGEAGTTIIADNMKTSKGKFLKAGIKKMCIYGFCDIRNFTDATEVL